MTKKEQFVRRKQIRNYIPKFDLGIENNLVQGIGYGVSENGYLTGNQYVKTARLDKLGASAYGKADAINAGIIGKGILSAIDFTTNTGTNAYDYYKQTSSQAILSASLTTAVELVIPSAISKSSLLSPVINPVAWKQSLANTVAPTTTTATSVAPSTTITPAATAIPATMQSPLIIPGTDLLYDNIVNPITNIATQTTEEVVSDIITPTVTNTITTTPSTVGTSAATVGLGTAGAALGFAALGKGIYDAIGVADQINRPVFTDKEFDEMEGELTLSGIAGQLYRLKTGVNLNDVAQVGAAVEGSDIASAANAGMGIGAGVGGATAGIMAAAGALSSIPILGWILGPALAAVGAGIGAGAGAGATDGKSEEAIEQANQVNNALSNWNAHEAAVANSKGMREVYQNRQEKLHGSTTGAESADYGRQPHTHSTTTKYAPMFGDIATSDGVYKGNVNAIVGRDEIVANTEESTAYVVKYGNKGSKENVLANLKDSDVVLSDNPNMIIPGTDILYKGGLTPAKAGRQSAEAIYAINRAVEKDSKYRDKKTQQFLQQLADKAKQPHVLNLKLLTDVQSYMKNGQLNNGLYLEHAKYGRLPKSQLTHLDWGGYLIPAIGGIGNLIGNGIQYAKAANEEIAPAPQIYRSNADVQRAISQMRSSYNIRPEQAEALRINRMLNYANRKGGYSAGQRMAMDQSAYANYANLMQKIFANGLNQSNALWNEKQKAIAQYRDADVTRQMESNKYASEWNAKANAAKQKRIDTFAASLYGNINSMMLNFSNAYWTDKNLSLYQQGLDSKKAAAASKMNPTATTYKFNPSAMNIYSGLPIFMQQYVKPFNLSKQ